MRQEIIRIALASILGLVVTGTTSAQDQGQVCDDVLELVQQAVPDGVGDPALIKRLLEPQVGPQFADLFLENAPNALPAVQSRLRISQRRCEKDEQGMLTCRFSNFRKTEFLKFDQRTGKAAYLNQRREWDPRKGDNKITPEQALALASEIVKAWGVPPEEVDGQWAEMRALNIAGGRDLDKKPAEFFSTEVHVRFPRHVSGVPVFDSDVQLALDTSGAVARLRTKWPSFGLVAGLTPAPLSRDEVVIQTAEELSRGALCKSLSRIDAHIAYVHAAELLATPDSSDEGEVEAFADHGDFLPALVVYAYPNEVREDSGELSMGGRQIVIPLLDAREDAQ